MYVCANVRVRACTVHYKTKDSRKKRALSSVRISVLIYSRALLIQATLFLSCSRSSKYITYRDTYLYLDHKNYLFIRPWLYAQQTFSIVEYVCARVCIHLSVVYIFFFFFSLDFVSLCVSVLPSDFCLRDDVCVCRLQCTVSERNIQRKFLIFFVTLKYLEKCESPKRWSRRWRCVPYHT